jgi:hypothetical protein
MNKSIKNVIALIIVAIYVLLIVIDLFFPNVISEVNKYLFFNDSVIVATIVFIGLCILSYLCFKEIVHPKDYQLKDRLYRCIRAGTIIFVTIFLGYNLFSKFVIFNV